MGRPVARTAHFAMHRCALQGAEDDAHGQQEAHVPGLWICRAVWIGAVLPKRWAKRAVTRNGIKRQIYNVSSLFETQLPHAAHVVRLRAGFERARFPSAWSQPLREAVRTELRQLFSDAAARRQAA